MPVSVSEIDGSLQDFIGAVRAAFEAQYPPRETGPDDIREYPYWIRDIYDDHIVVDDGTQLYRVDLTVADGEITFQPRSEWTKVRLSYIQEMTVGEFRGDFPEVPVAPEVDLEALKEGDPAPFFVTMPVGELGSTSGNGLYWDEELFNGVIQQINANRPTGIMGHLRVEDRSSAYPPPDIFWLGASQQGNTAWAKGYVPPGEARDTLRRLKAVGGKAATSIYGRPGRRVQLGGGRWKAEDFRLESLDLAPYERAALKLGGAFAVTAEMDSHTYEREEDTMPTKAEIIAELTVDDLPQALREQIISEHQKATDDSNLVAELRQEIETKDARVQELEGQVQQYQLAEFNASLDGLVAEFVKIEAKDDAGKASVDGLRKGFRARLVAEIGEERDPDKIKAVAQTIWDAEYKPLAEMMVKAIGGPSARVGGKGGNWRDELAERADELRKERGV